MHVTIKALKLQEFLSCKEDILAQMAAFGLDPNDVSWRWEVKANPMFTVDQDGNIKRMV